MMRKQAVFLALLGGVVALACACAGTTARPDATGVAAQEGAAGAAKATKVEPPDGRWLVDEQGRQYFVKEYLRVDGHYDFLDEAKTRARLPYGVVYDLAGFDDEKLYLKLYRVEDVAPVARQAPDLKALAKTFETSWSEVDSLHFVERSGGLPTSGQWREGFDLADMNGDGQLDIVHGPARKGRGTPAIFLGDGKGGWRRWQEARFSVGGLDYGDATVADFNGDGLADIAFGVHLRGIVVLIGDGKGRFSPWSKGIEFSGPESGATAAPFSSRALRAFDWNRDGKMDVIASGEGPRLIVQGQDEAGFVSGARGFRVFLNYGDGTWSPLYDGKHRKDYGDDLAAADLDGDGFPDLIGASNVWGSKSIVGWGREDGSWEVLPFTELRDAISVRSVAVADLDGDGRVEILLGFFSRELGVWRSAIDVFSRHDQVAGWTRRTLFAEEGKAGMTALAVGDLNADGRPDVAAASGSRLLVFLGDGRGGFQREIGDEMAATAPGCLLGHVAVRDLDGDGYPEIVANFAGETGTRMGIADVDEALAKLDTCPGQGMLRVWSARPKSAASISH